MQRQPQCTFCIFKSHLVMLSPAYASSAVWKKSFACSNMLAAFCFLPPPCLGAQRLAWCHSCSTLIHSVAHRCRHCLHSCSKKIPPREPGTERQTTGMSLQVASEPNRTRLEDMHLQPTPRAPCTSAQYYSCLGCNQACCHTEASGANCRSQVDLGILG